MTCWQYTIKKNETTTTDLKIKDSICSRDTEIRPISYEEAKKFILKYEWLGNMGYGNICYGLFYYNNLLAVVVFGPHLSRCITLKSSETISLPFQIHRGASAPSCPTWGPSRLIRHSLRLLHLKYNIQIVFCYADPLAGEIGTIYQACGAKYLGLTNPGGAKYIWINQKKYHPRAVYRKYGSRCLRYLEAWGLNVKTEIINPKYRYAFILNNEKNADLLINNLKYNVLPYPKRSNLIA